MNRTALLAAFVSTVALAQVRVDVNLTLPTITFEVPPPLVVIQPGVQVVEDFDDEVFFVDNVYWCRRGDRWYRAPDHHGRWVVVERAVVPATIVRLPPGQYKRWRSGRGNARGTTVVVDPPGPGKVKVKTKHKK